MPDWSSFKTKYVIEPDDLPNPHGPNLVVIEGFDTEQYEDPKTKETKLRHNMYLAGWDKPLRLNNTRIDILKQIFGPTTEQAVGGKIALLVGMSSAYGETKPTIMIHPYMPSQDAEPAAVPDRCATKAQMRLAQAREFGVTIAPPQRKLAERASQQTTIHMGTAPAHGEASSMGVHAVGDAKLGFETAAEIGALLKERNRDFEWIAKHMQSTGMADLVAGATPADWAQAARGPIWAVLRNTPVVNKISDREAFKADLVNSWKPTLAQEAKAAAAADDDIPF